MNITLSGRPGAAWAYFLAAFLVKLSFFLFFADQGMPGQVAMGQFYAIKGDARDYVEPVENLLAHGEFRSDSGEYAQRMPGYAAVYLPLRALLPQMYALNATMLMQVALSAASCYALGLIAFWLFNSLLLFRLVFWSYVLSTYVSIWDLHILTESFAASALIFGTAFLVRGLQRSRHRDLLVAGLFLTWCVFLRPFMVPVLGLYALAVLLVPNGTYGRWKVIALMGLLGPFIAIDAVWTARNWTALDRFVPMQSRVTYNDGALFSPDNPARTNVSDLMRSFGADHTWWNPIEPAYAFMHADAPFTKNEFPSVLFSPEDTFADLEHLRSISLELESGDLPDSLVRMRSEELASGLHRFYDHYKNDHPVHFYVTSRLIHLKRFLVNTGVYNLPFPAFAHQALWMKAIKAFYALVYLLVVPVGFLCCLGLFIVRFNLRSIRTYLYAVPIYLALLFPLVFKVHEYRFNTLCYPFLLIVVCYLASDLWQRFSRRMAHKA